MSSSQPTQDSLNGAMLRAMREGAGLSRRGLATRANVEQSHLARYEYGERRMSTDKLNRILEAIAATLRGDAA